MLTLCGKSLIGGRRGEPGEPGVGLGVRRAGEVRETEGRYKGFRDGDTPGETTPLLRAEKGRDG